MNRLAGRATAAASSIRHLLPSVSILRKIAPEDAPINKKEAVREIRMTTHARIAIVGGGIMGGSACFIISRNKAATTWN